MAGHVWQTNKTVLKGTEPPETADLSRERCFVVSLTQLTPATRLTLMTLCFVVSLISDPTDPWHTPHTYDSVLVFVVTLATWANNDKHSSL